MFLVSDTDVPCPCLNLINSRLLVALLYLVLGSSLSGILLPGDVAGAADYLLTLFFAKCGTLMLEIQYRVANRGTQIRFAIAGSKSIKIRDKDCT